MTQTAQGSLTMVGLNTKTPEVFWHGLKVSGVVAIRVDWENDEQRIKLRVNGTDEELYSELIANGINIKRAT